MEKPSESLDPKPLGVAPLKLIYRRDRLYEISRESKPVKKRTTEFVTLMNVIPWYRKLKEGEWEDGTVE